MIEFVGILRVMFRGNEGAPEGFFYFIRLHVQAETAEDAVRELASWDVAPNCIVDSIAVAPAEQLTEFHFPGGV